MVKVFFLPQLFNLQFSHLKSMFRYLIVHLRKAEYLHSNGFSLALSTSLYLFFLQLLQPTNCKTKSLLQKVLHVYSTGYLITKQATLAMNLVYVL